jgi:nucleoside phosphorylase
MSSLRYWDSKLRLALTIFRFIMRELTDKWSDAHLRRTYDTSTAHLLVVAPTERELAGLRPNRLSGFGVAEVGLGRAAADNLCEILKTRRPQILLSIGFGGALAGSMRTGDVVVSVEATAVQVPTQRIGMHPGLTDEAMGALITAGMRVTKGSTLTVPTPLMSGGDKQRHGASTGASVVDMETFWIAQEADRAGVPLVTVRTVIDEMHHDLPNLVAHITADGGQREWYHTLRAMKNPTNVGALVPLATRSRKAVGALRAVVDVLLPVLTKDAPVRAAHR